MARGDQLAQQHLISDVVENLAQPFLVAPVRRGGDPEDTGIGIGVAHPVDDAAVTVSHRMMRFVDHQQVKARHVGEVRGPCQRRHHGEGDLTTPGFLGGIDHRSGNSRHHPLEFGTVLGGQFVAMGQHAGLGSMADHLAGDRRQHDGLASTSGCHAQRVAAGGERSHAALDEGLLAGAQAHGRSPLTAPSSADRHCRGRKRAGWDGWWPSAAGHSPAGRRCRSARRPSPSGRHSRGGPA